MNFLVFLIQYAPYHQGKNLNDEISIESMFELITIRTRQFARRQEKWFKKEPIDLYLQMDQLEKKKIPEILDCFLERIL